MAKLDTTPVPALPEALQGMSSAELQALAKFAQAAKGKALASQNVIDNVAITKQPDGTYAWTITGTFSGLPIRHKSEKAKVNEGQPVYLNTKAYIALHGEPCVVFVDISGSAAKEALPGAQAWLAAQAELQAK